MSIRRQKAEPLVSIVTPVYNGARYLDSCIQSVLKQNYTNWDYTIVNNRSIDDTLEIAKRYASSDHRIRVTSNTKFVNCEENHNIAFQKISKESKYCKVVSADDVIHGTCLKEMVSLAERYPKVGIVGSYQNSNGEIKWMGLPERVEVISGKEVCRKHLLGQSRVFGNPTSVLYLSDLIRSNMPFFPHHKPHADTSACYKHLYDYDFGFVHKILSTEGVHSEQVSSKVQQVHMDAIECLDDFLAYGPKYFSQKEYEFHHGKIFAEYYKWLGGCLLKMKGFHFWRYQINGIKGLSADFQWTRVLKGALDEALAEIRNPKSALEKLLSLIRN